MKIRVRTLLLIVGAIGVSATALAWRPRRPETLSSVPDPQTVNVTDLRHRLATLAVALVAGATQGTPEPPRDASLGLTIATNARAQLARPDRDFRDDCSGYVSAVLTASGVPADGRVATLWDSAVAHDALYWSERPRAGDLIFFDNTWDRDHDGRQDDELTHIGIVLDIAPDDTVLFAHAGLSTGRGTGHLNLHDPSRPRGPDGDRWNSALRNRHPGDPAGTPTLAGELWVAFASVDGTADWLRPPPPP